MIAVRPFVAADTEAVADFWVRAWNQTMPQFDFEERRAVVAGAPGERRRAGDAAIMVAGEGASRAF